MRLPRKGEEVDYEHFCEMADTFIAEGFNYFDTAHAYLGKRSERSIGDCVSARHKISDFLLTDKLTDSFFRSQEDIRPFFERQLELCKVDYFDFYLMHAQDRNIYQKFKRCNAYETAFRYIIFLYIWDRKYNRMEKYGLIGHPIAHSASPALFTKAYGGRWQYDLIDGELFDVAWKRFLEGYRAINITAPFKEPAFREVLSDGVMDADVQAIGAINIAVKEADGKIHGYNSDYLGVMKVLRDHGFGEGSTVVVAGFGGAGKAAAAAGKALGCDVVICNRTRHTPDIRPLEELPVLAGVADILIYTLAFPIPELDGLEVPAILEANYRTPCLAGRPGYIPGTEWHRAQAETGYPLMTGCPVSVGF